MKRLHRIALLSLCAALIMSLLAGCITTPAGPGDDFEVDIHIPFDITAELTLSLPAYDMENWIVDGLIEGFNKIYPNVTIKKDQMAGDTVSIMMGYWQAKKMPDIFHVTCVDVLNFDKAGIVLNLESYIEAETENGTFNASDYIENFWKLGQRNYNGDQIMVPRTSDLVFCQINKKILRECGIDCDSPESKIKNGWTWDDFMDVCREVKAKRPSLGVVDTFMNWEAVYDPIFKSCGTQYWNENMESAINSPETETALQLMKELYILNGNNYSGNYDGGQAPFMLHSRAPSVSIKMLKDTYGDAWQDDWYDMVTFPLVNPERPFIACGDVGYAISSTAAAEKRDLAWKFLKYVVSREGQNSIANAGVNFPPMRKDMLDTSKPEDNHWAAGFESYNMEALSWPALNNCLTTTDFNIVRPSRALDLLMATTVMVNNYVVDGYTAAKAMSTCANTMNYWLEN